MTDEQFKAAQLLLDQLGGRTADVSYFYADGDRKVYTCSSRLLNGDLAYGTGQTLAEAVRVAQTEAPIRAKGKAA